MKRAIKRIEREQEPQEARPLRPAEVGKKLNKTTQTIIRWCREGVFPGAYQLGREFFIPANEVELAKKKPYKEGK